MKKQYSVKQRKILAKKTLGDSWKKNLNNSFRVNINNIFKEFIMNLKGKTVIVTGASTGIGRETSIELKKLA